MLVRIPRSILSLPPKRYRGIGRHVSMGYDLRRLRLDTILFQLLLQLEEVHLQRGILILDDLGMAAGGRSAGDAIGRFAFAVVLQTG